MTDFKITQSFMKDFVDYKQGKECGLYIKAKYMDGIQKKTTDLQLLGQWFEFMATGALPKSGIKPIPPKLKEGGLPAEYRRMEIQALRLINHLAALGFKFIKVGPKLQHGNIYGDFDLLCERNGKACIVDIKSTGMLDNKWEDMGWHEDFLEEKHKITVQAVHYTWLYEKIYKSTPDFYFFVYSTTNEVDAKVFKMIIDPARLERHSHDIEIFEAQVNLELAIGFEPFPDMKRCSNCPLFFKCEKKTELPTIKEIYIS